MCFPLKILIAKKDIIGMIASKRMFMDEFRPPPMQTSSVRAWPKNVVICPKVLILTKKGKSKQIHKKSVLDI